MDTPGFYFGTKEDKLGIRASSTANLIMDFTHIPSTNLLGAEGERFKISMKTLEGGRIGVPGQSLGIASTSIDCTVHYAPGWNMFGKPIAKLQNIENKISKMVLVRYAARLLTWRDATMKDEGLKYTRKAEMAKLAANKAATICEH